MGTSFEEIYKLNEPIRDDNRLIGQPINKIYELYYQYLKYSISYFSYDCYNDLDNYIPFSQQEYNFIGNGTDNEFLLDPPPSPNSLFCVATRITDDCSWNFDYTYTFDSNTNILTVSPTPFKIQVYIASYIIGEFSSNLTNKEQVILAEGMNVPWSQEKQFKNSLLNQMVYGANTKIYSQSQHIKEVKDVANNQYFSIVKGMINEYSYKANPNKLIGLGGSQT